MAPEGNPMSGLDLLIPFIIALAKQTGLSRTANLLIAIAIYAIWSAISLYFGLRDLPHGDMEQIITSFPVAFAAALGTGYVAYKTIWGGLLGEEKITAATSINKAPEDDEVVIDEVESEDTPPPTDAVG